jgi:hypothetical protein
MSGDRRVVPSDSMHDDLEAPSFSPTRPHDPTSLSTPPPPSSSSSPSNPNPSSSTSASNLIPSLSSRLAPLTAFSYSSSDWLASLDVDGDGQISSHDLIDNLFVVGATLSITDFDTLLARVQADAASFETVTFGKFSPDELRDRRKSLVTDHCQGCWPLWQLLPVRILSYVMCVPMLNVTWPLRTFPSRTAHDKAMIATHIWKAGLSFQLGLVFFYFPAVVLWLTSEPASINVYDVLNTYVLYVICAAFLMNMWACSGSSVDYAEEQLAVFRSVYSLNYVRLEDASDKLKLDCCKECVSERRKGRERKDGACCWCRAGCSSFFSPSHPQCTLLCDRFAHTGTFTA